MSTYFFDEQELIGADLVRPAFIFSVRHLKAILNNSIFFVMICYFNFAYKLNEKFNPPLKSFIFKRPISKFK
jgi:hypothetical protein